MQGQSAPYGIPLSAGDILEWFLLAPIFNDPLHPSAKSLRLYRTSEGLYAQISETHTISGMPMVAAAILM